MVFTGEGDRFASVEEKHCLESAREKNRLASAGEGDCLVSAGKGDCLVSPRENNRFAPAIEEDCLESGEEWDCFEFAGENDCLISAGEGVCFESAGEKNRLISPCEGNCLISDGERDRLESAREKELLAFVGEVSLDVRWFLVCTGERDCRVAAEEGCAAGSVPTSPFSQASSRTDTLEGLLALGAPFSVICTIADTLPMGDLTSSLGRSGVAFFQLKEEFVMDPPVLPCKVREPPVTLSMLCCLENQFLLMLHSLLDWISCLFAAGGT